MGASIHCGLREVRLSDQDDLPHRLQVAIESNERHRSRARATAALCAAAAGALAAGLILTPSMTIPMNARVLGLLAITLLIVATALNVAASSASTYEAGASRLVNFLHASEAWRVRAKSASGGLPSAPTYDDLIGDAKALTRVIVRTTSWGLWAAGIASAALVGSLAVAALQSDATEVVTVEFGTPPSFVSCPTLGVIATGEVVVRDLASDSSLLPLRISAKDCGNRLGATLHVDKSLVAIVK